VRYIKGKIYKKVLKFFCRFPLLVKIFYNLFKNIVIYFPFIRTTYKWRMIKPEYLNFELERSLVKKGKLNIYNKLFNIQYSAGDKIENYRDLKKISNGYRLGISPKGLRITGKIKLKNISNVFLKIDGMTIKKFNVEGLDRFAITVKTGSLSKFPEKSVLTVEMNNDKKLLYKKSDMVELIVPFGDGALESIIGEGFFLSKKGTMATNNSSLDIKRKKYLDLYSTVKSVFEKELNIQLFLTYGTLLGYVREGDFIANDDDFDAGYISQKPNPEQVKQEALDIIFKLLKQGFNVSINSVGRLFKVSNGTGVSLDVMPVWFEGEWNVAYRGACVKSSFKDYLPVGKGIMRDHEVFIPNNSEVFLAGYYGENWKVPDPGYVSNFEQTGKILQKNYLRYLITPLEYKKFDRLVEKERINNSNMGKLSATALRGALKIFNN